MKPFLPLLAANIVLLTPGFSLDFSEEGSACFFAIDSMEEPSAEAVGFWGWLTAKHGDFLGYPRNYHAPVTAGERADIHYIVTFLADKSLMTIAKHRSELEEAGDRINHLHPLRFLMTVFTDEKLKVAIRNIRSRGWVWDSFYGGLKESLITEASLQNLKPEQLQHFARTVDVSPSVLDPAIKKDDWDLFIDLLIKHVPRKGDHGRYDN